MIIAGSIVGKLEGSQVHCWVLPLFEKMQATSEVEKAQVIVQNFDPMRKVGDDANC